MNSSHPASNPRPILTLAHTRQRREGQAVSPRDALLQQKLHCMATLGQVREKLAAARVQSRMQKHGLPSAQCTQLELDLRNTTMQLQAIDLELGRLKRAAHAAKTASFDDCFREAAELLLPAADFQAVLEQARLWVARRASHRDTPQPAADA